ncbi:hypothetical protein PSHT_10396, partial [Puccinia striiformis]
RHLHQVDFDLMAVFLMQEMGADLDIRDIVRMILGHFGNGPHPLTTGNVSASAGPHASPGPPPTATHRQPPAQITFSPKTPLQAQIHHAALLVNATLRHYDRTPTTSIPFCVRYPTYTDVLAYSIFMEKRCVPLPEDRMVVLIDGAGICVGVGVPPIPADEDGLYLAHDERALMSLNDMVLKCKWNAEKEKIVYSEVPPLGDLQTPHPLDMVNKGDHRDPKPKETKTTTQKSQSKSKKLSTKDVANPTSKPRGKTTISFQPYGFGLGDVHSSYSKLISIMKTDWPPQINSTGMQDLKIPLDRNGVQTSEVQGHGTSWKVPRVVPTLPNPQRESPNAVDAREMAKVSHEMCFYSTLSLWINKGFLSQSIAVAEKGVKYLQEKGCELLQENLSFEKNPVLAARTISLNTQITTHRDKKNALLFDSNFFFGNHLGGDFLLPSLGVAYCGLQGFSFHGPLRIVLHGVAKFHFPPNLQQPPRRYSVAYWARESSFFSVGRVSAYTSGNKVFNHDEYWIPMYPKYNFNAVHEVYSTQKSSSRIRPHRKKKGGCNTGGGCSKKSRLSGD